MKITSGCKHDLTVNQSLENGKLVVHVVDMCPICGAFVNYEVEGSLVPVSPRNLVDKKESKA